MLDTLQRHAAGQQALLAGAVRAAPGRRTNCPTPPACSSRLAKQVPEHDAAWFREAYASFQLDRAVGHALAGEAGEARARLRDVENMPESGSRAALVRAILAARADDAAGALTEATDNLLDHPEELDIFLPLLQDALLRGGQFTRTIPLLETACLSENAPASFAINLAILYEKLDQRDKAMRVLTIKAGQADLTPERGGAVPAHARAREPGHAVRPRVEDAADAAPAASTGSAATAAARTRACAGSAPTAAASARTAAAARRREES